MRKSNGFGLAELKSEGTTNWYSTDSGYELIGPRVEVGYMELRLQSTMTRAEIHKMVDAFLDSGELTWRVD